MMLKDPCKVRDITHVPLHHTPGKINSGHGGNNPSAQQVSSASKTFCKKTLFHTKIAGCTAMSLAMEVISHLGGCKSEWIMLKRIAEPFQGVPELIK